MLRRNWRMAFIIFSKFLPGRRAIRTVFCFITAISAIFIGLATIPARANAKVHNKLGGGGYDGPAELPIATVASSMADTPAPGSVINVKSGGDLQSALNNAQCGDTVELQAGSTFTGTFQFPTKKCDSQHWVIVRTSAADSSLPAERQRLTPCFAGVASLLGRPQYPCPQPDNVLAKIVSASGSSSGPVVLHTGANHYRLLGLELTLPTTTKGAPTLVAVQATGNASYIVVDRSWLHGTAQDEIQNGIGLAGTNNLAIVDSYFSDFHCTYDNPGCAEAHAISGGTGNNQDGPYEIRNNFLEASDEAILIGGGAATTTPTDITIHYNHFFKPWQWLKGNSPYQGGQSNKPFGVRNHLELKNAARVLIEGNLMENVWGGFTQNGFGILLTPKNQHTQHKGNVCSICEVTDVTIRYTQISHAGGGIVLATTLSGSGHGGAAAKAATRFSIHDIVMDDINQKYNGLGWLFLISNSWPKNPVNTISIDHITAFPDANSGVLMLGNKNSNPTMYGFTLTNSIVITGQAPVWNQGGGETSCAHANVPVTSLDKCFSSYTFTDNALVADPSNFPPSSWPKDVMFAQTVNDVDFTNYNGGNGGDYELTASSPYKNMGTDGKDLGADIVGLQSELADVE